ncbi:MAG: precorrin-2 C(20)-methyltransferase [Eubacteriales bacterium]|nr:precorrin-2 C(20)-methyltransferase [Eubacteriales bacterium]
MSGILFGVGVGPGDPEEMTLKAVRTIRENQYIAVPGKEVRETVAYKIAVGAVPELDEKELIPLYMPMIKDKEEIEKYHDRAADVVEGYLKEGKNVVFLTLGDPTIYSTYMYVHKRIKERGYPTKVISGIPSFCAAAARMDISLTEWNEELHVIPAVHNIESDLNYTGTRVLMKSARKMAQVKEKLAACAEKVYMVEDCGMKTERIYTDVKDIPDEASYYSLIIVK